jgi:hypothetical protein
MKLFHPTRYEKRLYIETEINSTWTDVFLERYYPILFPELPSGVDVYSIGDVKYQCIY